jgi:hypothetical protein
MNFKNIASKACLIGVSMAALVAASMAHAGFLDERTDKEKASTADAPAPSVAASGAVLAASVPMVAASGVAVAVVPAAPVAPSVKSWDVLTSDVTLMKTFQRWAKDAGYTLRWDAEKNFVVSGPNTVYGDFERAVHDTLDTPGIAFSDFPLEACVYPNKPLLMRITRKGAQALECPSVAIPVPAGMTGATAVPKAPAPAPAKPVALPSGDGYQMSNG